MRIAGIAVAILATAIIYPVCAVNISAEFTGAVVPTPCRVTNDGQTVNMGRVMREAFSGVGSEKNATPFTIDLEGCEGGTSVWISMHGTPDPHFPNYFALAPTERSASGVAIKILSYDNKLQNPNGEKLWWKMSSDSRKLSYTASYIQTTSAIGVGVANALVTFDVEYR
ncbi:Type-1A pilin [Serratia quinivorans]|uniref:fimbrial protein n=1 Tax=Serratia quinivorans TaxID=137545 RepID=UPI002177360C|nr:fimbrial protein [Serratia quinivorans]CAI1604569.1 Type-1A pilin [Serratia quinivorans]